MTELGSIPPLDADPPAPAARTTGRVLPLSILLISSDASLNDLDISFDDDHTVEWYVHSDQAGLGERRPDPDLAARLQVGLRRAKRGVPGWRPFLRELGVELTEDPTGRTESALIAVRCEDSIADEHRWLLFCFGGIGRSIPTEITDSRFGIISALNKQSLGDTLPPWRIVPAHAVRRRPATDRRPAVRNLRAEVHDGHRHRMTATSDSPSPLRGLRFDQVSDLLRGLSVTTDDEAMRDLSGDRSLRFSTYLESFEDFTNLADYLFALRLRTDYRADWEWVDNVVPVSTRAQADRILTSMAQRIGTDREPLVDLVMPEWDTMNAVSAKRLRVALPGERHRPSRVLMGWEQIRDWIVRTGPHDARKTPVLRSELRVSVEGDDTVERIKIADLIVAELEDDEQQYIISEGVVYRVEQSFLQRLNADLATLPWSSFPFPTYTGGNEPGYLNSVVGRSGDRVALLDRKNITLPGETAFEPCDNVTDDGTMVFAKHKGKSALFSHLCTQVVASAELLFRVPRARELFLDRVFEATTNESILEIMTDQLGRLDIVEPKACGCASCCSAPGGETRPTCGGCRWCHVSCSTRPCSG